MYKGKTKTGAEVSNTAGFNLPHTHKTWILVANRSGAKLFETVGLSQQLPAPRQFTCAHGRIRESELFRDDPGRMENGATQSHDGKGSGGSHHASAGDATHHDLIARKFATTLADMLEKESNEHRFEKLVLVAEPRFLGILKSGLSSQVSAKVTRTLEKDIEQMPNQALGKHLIELLNA